MATEEPRPELTPRQSAQNLSSLSTDNNRPNLNEDVVKGLIIYKEKDPANKVVVRFKAVGNAPIMKQNTYKATATNTFQSVITSLRNKLGWQKGDPLFLYINSMFSPAPDDTVLNLFKSFSTECYLIVNYCTTPAWG